LFKWQRRFVLNKNFSHLSFCLRSRISSSNKKSWNRDNLFINNLFEFFSIFWYDFDDILC
jgi:hypothetical protein